MTRVARYPSTLTIDNGMPADTIVSISFHRIRGRAVLPFPSNRQRSIAVGGFDDNVHPENVKRGPLRQQRP